MKFSAYASEYKRLYNNDEEEVAALMGDNARLRGGGIGTGDPMNPRLHWWPSRQDFSAEAAKVLPAVPVRYFWTLLAEIKRRKGLETVYCFSHGARGELQFGGGNKLTMGEISVMSNADVSANFQTGGKVVFVACNTAQDRVFLQAIANALHVRVEGFPDGVKWSLEFVGLAPHRKITRRGLDNREMTLHSAQSFNPMR